MSPTSRFVALTCVSLGGFFLGRRALSKVVENPEEAVGQVAEKVGIGGQAQEPLQLLARGATQVGEIFASWSAEDLSLGLAALAKVSEKQPPPTPGVATPLDKDPGFLWLVQRARALAEAAYCKDPASFSLAAGVAESQVVEAAWEPCGDSFCPAYVVCLDPELGGAVVLVVRGTENVVDALVDAAGVSAPLGGEGGDRYAHGGFLHGARTLTERVRTPLRRAFAAAQRKDVPLLLVGHSLGAAVAALSAALLREEWPNVFVVGFGCPPCVDAQTARDCREHVLNFVAGHDVVPRFSVGSLERLRVQLQEQDWGEVEALAEGDPDFEKICAGARLVRDWSSKASGVVKQAQGAASWVQKAGGKTGGKLEEMKSGAAAVASRACKKASGGKSDEDTDHRRDTPEGAEEEEGKPKDEEANKGGEREDDGEWTKVGVDEAEAGESGGKGEGAGEVQRQGKRQGKQVEDDGCEGVKEGEDKGSPSEPPTIEESGTEEEEGDDDVRIEELDVPGRCFVVWSSPPGSGVPSKSRDNVPQQRSLGAYPTFDDVERQKVEWQLREVGADDLKKVIISPWCISDHMPGHVGEGIAHVQLRAPPLVDLSHLFAGGGS